MTPAYAGERASLVELVDRLIGRGVVLNGDLVLSLAGVDLVYLGLRSVLAPAHVVPIEKQVLGHVGGADSGPGANQPIAPPPQREASRELTTGLTDEGAHRAERSAAPATVDDGHERQVAPGRAAESSSEALPALAETADPEEIQRGLVQLVLTLVELVRQLMERQAIRRVEAGGLDDDQVERLGQALMMLETAVTDLRERFGVSADDLNLDLGPLGRLL